MYQLVAVILLILGTISFILGMIPVLVIMGIIFLVVFIFVVILEVLGKIFG